MFASSISEFAQQQGIPLWLLVFAVLWSLIWKGIAWWKSARLGQPAWFVAFFIVNTLGILEILYIFLFSKMKLPVPQDNRRSTRQKQQPALLSRPRRRR